LAEQLQITVSGGSDAQKSLEKNTQRQTGLTILRVAQAKRFLQISRVYSRAD